MRVGLYTPSYPGLTGDGGIGSYTRTLARGLAAAGHAVHVLAPGDRPAADDGPVRVHFTRTDYLPVADNLAPGAGACWRVFRAARGLVRAHGLDVFEFPNYEGHGLVFARLGRVPTVVRLHTSSLEGQKLDGAPPSRFRRWDVRRERWLARSAAGVVTHSDAHRRVMVTETGLDAERIHLIPHGVEAFPGFVRPHRADGPPVVVFLGRLEQRKGAVELLHAIALTLQEVPDARFVLIGSDGPRAPGGRTHVQYLADEFPASVRQRVTLAGVLPQPEVDRHLQTADLFVAPSRYESFGLIYLEAMRWGTPVVGTTAGGIPEVVEHGRSGWLVPPGDAAGLAAGLVRLLRDPGLRAELRAAGRARVERELTVGRMVERVATFYAEVAHRRRLH